MIQTNQFSMVSNILNTNNNIGFKNRIEYIDNTNYYRNDSLAIPQKNNNYNNPFNKANKELTSIFNKIKNSAIGNLSKLQKFGQELFHTEPKEVVTTNHKDARGNKIKVRGDVVQPLNSLIQIAGQKGIKVSVSSSYRSVDHQKELWNKALKKYGSVAKARKWVAPPGKSRHNHGVALDVSMYKNGKKIKQGEFDKIIAQAGFYRPMSWEGWHIEPLSTKAGRGLA